MRLTRLLLEDFRSYATAELHPDVGLTIVAGPNGAGKTNLLEAIFVAVAGRSHRAGPDTEMVRYLASKGADVKRYNRAGQTTIDVANGPVQRTQPYPDTIKLLEEPLVVALERRPAPAFPLRAGHDQLQDLTACRSSIDIISEKNHMAGWRLILPLSANFA